MKNIQNISDKNTPIYIIGAGAIGKALAVCLTLNKKNVILLRGTVDDGISYDEEINLVSDNRSVAKARIPVRTLSHFSALNGLVILANKTYGNIGLAKKLKPKINSSPILLLQNGLGIERCFIEHGFWEIYRCVLFVSGDQNTKNTICYKPVSVSLIGTIRSQHNRLETLVKQLNTECFPFRAEQNIEKTIWEKVILNCVFNSVCPLLNTDNGIFYRNPEVFALAKKILRETIDIAAEKGFSFDLDKMEKQILTISRVMQGQTISTLQDILKGRETEINTLNLEIVRLARKLKKEHRVQHVKLLGELVNIKSAVHRSVEKT